MKNPYEVLRMKEQELIRVKKEVEALRIVVKMLGDEEDAQPEGKVELRQAIPMP
jgi:hypothetical protein